MKELLFNNETLCEQLMGRYCKTYQWTNIAYCVVLIFFCMVDVNASLNATDGIGIPYSQAFGKKLRCT